MTGSLRTRAFTVEEFHRMAEAGILSEDDRVELIDGEIIPMTPIGPRHAACVSAISTRIIREVGSDITVYVQNPLQLDAHSEFYPDVMLLKARADRYRQTNPGPQDVLLLIEVADASIDQDREHKLPRYATARIPEVWLIDLRSKQVEVFQHPSGAAYTYHEGLGQGASLTPALVPSLTVKVDDLIDY